MNTTVNIIVCPKCGTENPASAMNCRQCKINLEYALANSEVAKGISQDTTRPVAQEQPQQLIKPVPTSIRDILFSFDGRIGRQTFWLSIIALYVVFGIAVSILGSIRTNQVIPTVAILLLAVIYIFFICANLAIQVKRWHDRNKSGWWVIINAIPYLGTIWAIIELGFLKGTFGPNRFGDDPLQVKSKKANG